jgi:hypothetical protein
MTVTRQAASPELAAARAAWADPFRDTGHEGLAALTAAASVGTVVDSQNWLPTLTVAQEGCDGPYRWVRLTGDGTPAEPGQWCRCQPPPDDWAYYETWHPTLGRTAHGWVHASASCRRLVQSG